MLTKYYSRKKAKIGFVYVITDGRYYKIGRTHNLKQRLGELQTGNKEVLGYLWYKRYKDYIRAERILHEMFAAYRYNGSEWFNLDRQSKVLLEKIFTEKDLDEREKESLERLGLL